MTALTVVKFQLKHRPYNAGETAGFPSDSPTLAHLLKQGIAVVHDVPRPAEPERSRKNEK